MEYAAIRTGLTRVLDKAETLQDNGIVLLERPDQVLVKEVQDIVAKLKKGLAAADNNLPDRKMVRAYFDTCEALGYCAAIAWINEM